MSVRKSLSVTILFVFLYFLIPKVDLVPKGDFWYPKSILGPQNYSRVKFITNNTSGMGNGAKQISVMGGKSWVETML